MKPLSFDPPGEWGVWGSGARDGGRWGWQGGGVLGVGIGDLDVGQGSCCRGEGRWDWGEVGCMWGRGWVGLG